MPGLAAMRRAFAEKDPAFDGLFVVAVKTTGIFCRHGEDHRLSAQDCRDAFAAAHFVETADASRALQANPVPKILVSASGMATGGRTAPSAHAANEIDVYVALPQGVYRYEPLPHRLVLKHRADARNMTGYQDFVGTAPLDLVYVVRTSALADEPPQQRGTFAAIAAGAMAQNVSLYCASEGLAAVVRGWINHRLLAHALSLNEDELPLIAQTIGKPA